MASVTRSLGAAGVGAGLMYLFDPRSGRRRRAELRDEVRHLAVIVRVGLAGLSWAAADGFGEFTGRLARVVHADRAISDATVWSHAVSAIEQITQSRMAVQIRVHRGRVTLSGRVHAVEIAPIIAAVESVPGVVSVHDDLHLREPSPSRPARRRIVQELRRQTRWWPVVAILAGTVVAARSETAPR